MDEIIESVNTELVAETQPIESTQLSQDPISYEDNNYTASEEPNEVDEVAKPPVKVEQDSETNHAFRELRVEKERLEKEQKDRDRYYAEKYGHLGINGEADYRRVLDEQEEEARQEEYNKSLNQAGINEEQFNKLIENNPKFKQVYEKNLKYEQDARANQVMGIYNNEISELVSEFEDLKDNFKGIKNTEELEEVIKKLPNGDKVLQKVVKGYSIADAYKLENLSTITQKSVASAKQQALNSVNGRQHLKSEEGGVDSESGSIPPDIYETYKKYNPQWSDDKIYSHYKKNK